MKAIHIAALVIIAAVVVSVVAYMPHEQEKTRLKVIYAGSLIVPFEQIEKQFESQHPGVDVQMEGHGSIQVIRQVTDIHKEVDVLAVADDSLIPDMMYPNYADWTVRFATNQMVIAYNNKSKYANEISVTKNGDTYIVFVPEVFEPRAEKVVIRGGSVQLIALLDYGGIDYAFEYKSVAQQHGLRFLELPAQIDLSSPDNFDKIPDELRPVVIKDNKDISGKEER